MLGISYGLIDGLDWDCFEVVVSNQLRVTLYTSHFEEITRDICTG